MICFPADYTGEEPCSKLISFFIPAQYYDLLSSRLYGRRTLLQLISFFIPAQYYDLLSSRLYGRRTLLQLISFPRFLWCFSRRVCCETNRNQKNMVKFPYSPIPLQNKSVFPMEMYCFCHCFLYSRTECIM